MMRVCDVIHTNPEVIVHVPREDGVMVIGPVDTGRFGAGLLSVLVFKPLPVADVHLFPVALQQGDEGLDHAERCVSKRNQD